MKSLIAAGILALSVAPFAAAGAQAEDFGAAVVHGAVRGAMGGPYHHDDWRMRHRYYEGRSGYGGDCRTVIVRRDTPDGVVTRKTRRCD